LLLPVILKKKKESRLQNTLNIMNEVKMNIKLQRVEPHELPELHRLQVASFQWLLDKYQDFETNPAAESLKKIEDRFAQPSTTYFFIKKEDQNIGAIRIIYREDEKAIRISPMFIHPDFQNQHLGQKAVLALEKEYPQVTKWTLDTILQEKKLCHFYEKLGYVDTGKRERIKNGMDIIYYEKLKN